MPGRCGNLGGGAHRVSVGRRAWTVPVLPQGAFLEERPAGPDQQLDQDERGGIVQVVLLAVDLRASVRSERQSKELKKPLPGASRRAPTVVPEPLLEWSTGELEAQAVARLAPRRAARQAEPQPEPSWRLRPPHLAISPEQPEPPLVAAQC